jgi:GNAT superfamily N-acetyltransferase
MARIIEVEIDSEEAKKAIECAEAELDRRYGPATDRSVADTAKFVPPKGTFFIALDDEGELAGGVGLRTVIDGVGEIKRLWVAEGARRQGVGAALMAAAEGAAQRFSMNLVELETGPLQPEAVALYETTGWERVQELPYPVSDYPRAARFVKRYRSSRS